jgi:hypothetical protein
MRVLLVSLSNFLFLALLQSDQGSFKEEWVTWFFFSLDRLDDLIAFKVVSYVFYIFHFLVWVLIVFTFGLFQLDLSFWGLYFTLVVGTGIILDFIAKVFEIEILLTVVSSHSFDLLSIHMSLEELLTGSWRVIEVYRSGFNLDGNVVVAGALVLKGWLNVEVETGSQNVHVVQGRVVPRVMHRVLSLHTLLVEVVRGTFNIWANVVLKIVTFHWLAKI